jgi:hypothetical protein
LVAGSKRLSTIGLLGRKAMHLESYTCEMCILQKEETLRHLFFKCAFAKNCQSQIEIVFPLMTRPNTALRIIKRSLKLPFAKEILSPFVGVFGYNRMHGFSTTHLHSCNSTFKKEFD